MRRLVSLLAACVALASCGSSGTPHVATPATGSLQSVTPPSVTPTTGTPQSTTPHAVTPPRRAPRSLRAQLVDAFAEPLWGNARTVRYSVVEPPWSSLEGQADLTAGRFALKFSDANAGEPVDAYVEGTQYWERTHSVDGDAWRQEDLRIDQPPLVTPQLPLFVPPEEPPQPSYIADANVRRQIVDAWLVSAAKLGTAPVHGVSAAGYRVHLSAVAPSHPLPAALTEELVRFDASRVDVTMDVWIDADGNVRRAVMPGFAGGQRWTIELWDQNAPIRVTRPADLARRPDDVKPPAPDPLGRTDVDVATGPRIGAPSGDHRTFTGDSPGTRFTARIIEQGGGSMQLEVTASRRSTDGVGATWTITAAAVGQVHTGTYPLGDQYDWTPEKPVGGINADGALVTKGCLGRVEVRELSYDTYGRPERVSVAFTAKCPSDGSDARRQFATTVTGYIHLHALTD